MSRVLPPRGATNPERVPRVAQSRGPGEAAEDTSVPGGNRVPPHHFRPNPPRPDGGPAVLRALGRCDRLWFRRWLRHGHREPERRRLGRRGRLRGGRGAAAAADARAAAAEPTPSTSAERQKFAKTRFVANAGLAAGATYQWIIKPYKAGKFKKGAKGRTFALVKAGLAGAFAYNRLKAAVNNAKGDPLLSKAVAPLTAGIESLKGLGSKLRKGDANDADVTNFQNVIGGVKDAGQSAGAPVQDQVPSLSQLRG